MTITKKELFQRLDSLPLKTLTRFRRRLRSAHSPAALAAISADMDKAYKRIEEISSFIPPITYPDLPVSARKEDIAHAITHNQVVIIAGETGSGKTTQIPKICLELGRGRRGLIGHTQPRRLAARSVAERIAEELGQEIGESVGYAIRFTDKMGPNAAIKLMTDGIILAELAKDPLLLAYDTIIIDEAHERSLNIDFLLGYLKQLLARRPDLKVIITSATIDPERFSRHFNNAPIIEVSGRTYPVEILYRPYDQEEEDQISAVIAAITELMEYGDGDILCFFATEREIRDMLEAIEGMNWPNTHAVPLYGRLSNEEQHRIFSPHAGRRIVLSTNIAETSLTVPGIHYVVDTGLARISRYSVRTKVQRLPIEAISQASANQRSGRCGRIANGIAIRLYSEQDFLSRPEFTDPEILRTNLASVILKMESLGVGDIPFVQEPDPKALRDGRNLLYELHALKEPGHKDRKENPVSVLTPIGHSLAALPVDPRLGRMLVEAHKNGCLYPVIVIVAALSISDIRERPLEFQAQADQLHARFKDKESDFSTYLNLWEYIRSLRSDLSGNAFRRRLREEYLHYMRSREWMDLVTQLRELCKELGWDSPRPSHNDSLSDRIHQSLLSGLLSHIGSRIEQTQQFQGARGTQFMIFPGSALAKKPPQFILAASLVETTRLWARDVAEINPDWLEKLAGQLLKKSYSEPHWSAKHQAAMVYERCQLYGITIYADRLIPYHKVDKEAARDMFIRYALVEGQWSTHHNFFHHNQKVLDSARAVEEKARRRDLIIEDTQLYEFYNARVPQHITSGAYFNSWFKKQDPHILDFDPEKLLTEGAKDISTDDFPNHWGDFDLSYIFDPTDPDDGITVIIPVPLITAVSDSGWEWLVPGMRVELFTELIRSLPKALRRLVVPAPDWASHIAPALNALHQSNPHAPLLPALAKELGHGISASDFNPASLPKHLRMNFSLIDKRGKIIDSDRDLQALKDRHAHHSSTTLGQWDKDITHSTTRTIDGRKVESYPALVIENNELIVKAMATKEEAHGAMLRSTLTLLIRDISIKANPMVKGLPLSQRVSLDNYPHNGLEGYISDAKTTAIRDLLLTEELPTSPEAYQKMRAELSPRISSQVRMIITTLAPAIEAWVSMKQELDNWSGPAIEDMEKQLATLLPPHAISIWGVSRLQHIPRYIEAMKIRLDNMGRDPQGDADKQEEIERVEALLNPHLPRTKEVKDILWMIQELRVSLFAQRLGTHGSVSVRRIEKAIAKLGS